MRAVIETVAAGPVSARVEKPPKEEAAGAGWGAYGESMRLRFFKVAISGRVGCKRIAPQACNDMIEIGGTDLSLASLGVLGWLRQAGATPQRNADPGRPWLM